MDNADTTRSGPDTGKRPPDHNFLVPIGILSLVYLSTLAPHSFWLDSSELAAASFSLGIPHPPGHPLYLFLGKLFSFIPIGGVGLKLSLASAFCGVLSAYFLAQILHIIGGRTLEGWSNMSHALILAITGLFGLSSAMWLQSVRPEVYTLQTALHLGIFWLLLEASNDSRRSDSREKLFLSACFLLALGGLNHHYLALFTFPAGLFVFSRLESRAKTFGKSICCALIPLAGYAFIAIRAGQNPFINWVNPQTTERFIDVILARVFQASVTTQEEGSIIWNFLEGLMLLMSQTSALLFPFVLLGALLLLKKARGIGFLVLIFLFFNLLSTSLMAFDRLNPDTWGYLQTSLGMWTLLACLGFGACVSQVFPMVESRQAASKWALVGLMSIIFTAQAIAHEPRSNLRSFTATERFEDATLSEMPPSSLHLSSFFGIYFNHWFSQVVEGRRPDVLITSQSFDQKIHEGIPHAENMLQHAGDWRLVFEAFLEQKKVPVGLLVALSETRPIFFEPEAPSHFTNHGRASGIVFQMCENCEKQGRPAAEDTYTQLQNLAKGNVETRTVMTWHHFQSAQLFKDMNDGNSSRREILFGETLVPESIQWSILRKQLEGLDSLQAEPK